MREVAELQEPQRSRKLNEIRAAELEKLIDREVVMEVATVRFKQLPPKTFEEIKREASKEVDHRLKDIKEQVKIKTDDEVKQFFAQQGMTIANFRRSVFGSPST